MSEQELKPCPFCGSEAKRVAGWATCSNDDCIVSDVGTVTSKWNTRADGVSGNADLWISVDKALPSRHSVCIVHIDYGDGGGYEIDVFARNWAYNSDKNITHWMLLPELPNA